MRAPAWSSATGRTSRCRSRCTGASRSPMDWAAFPFTPAMAAEKHGDWLGMMVRATWDRGRIEKAAFQFVRHDDRNRTVPRALGDEGAAFDRIARDSAKLGAKLVAQG